VSYSEPCAQNSCSFILPAQMRHKEPPAAMNHNAASDGIGWEPGSCVWTRRNLKTTLPLNPARKA
jgi:hypothetical protein